MEDIELEKIWNSCDNEVDRFMSINNQLLEMIQLRKARLKIRSLLLPKIIGIVLGIGWIAFMGMLIYFSILYSPTSAGKFFFIISIGLISLITAIAAIAYIYDIITIRQIDNSASITNAQKKLAELQLSVVNSTRIMWLQLPFYTTWYISDDMIAHGTVLFWSLQIAITASFIVLAVWLYKNVNNTNIKKNWLNSFVRGYGFLSVVQATGFIMEIEDFKKNR